MLQWNSSTDFATRECLGLHFQIDFRINVSGIERNVTQPDYATRSVRNDHVRHASRETTLIGREVPDLETPCS